MHTFFKKNIQTQSTSPDTGFTMVETLVAIFILLISITGPLSFAQSGLRASFTARDQIVAFYLAQDAIEMIKNTRDSKALAGESGDWLDTLGSCAPVNGSVTKCNIGYSTRGRAALACDGTLNTLCPKMVYDQSTREFRLHNRPGVESKYSRTIYLSELVPNREAQIIVVVEWEGPALEKRRVIVQENIYNWVPVFNP